MYDLFSLVKYYLGYTIPPEQSIPQAGPAHKDILKEGWIETELWETAAGGRKGTDHRPEGES